MIKTLYHGSKNIIKKPVFGKGNHLTDYGQGFYCTENIDMAKEWAVKEDSDGFANIYKFNLNGLKILDLSDEKYNILNWLYILLDNREFEITGILARDAKDFIFDKYKIDYKKYDVIIGYRADDSYFSFARDFINGAISLRILENAMKLGKLGIQIVLKSKKAFDNITFVSYEIAERDIWYIKRKQRDEKARTDYFDSERNKRMKGDIYIQNLLDGN